MKRLFVAGIFAGIAALLFKKKADDQQADDGSSPEKDDDQRNYVPLNPSPEEAEDQGGQEVEETAEAAGTDKEEEPEK